MKIKYSDLFSTPALTIILIFIGSPGYSLTQALFGIFLPNEKFVFIFFLFIIYQNRRLINKNFLKLLKSSLIIFVIYLLFFISRELLFAIPLTTANINNFLGLVSTLLFSTYLSFLKKDTITKGLIYSQIFQIFIAFCQIFFILTGNLLIYAKFNNHYLQDFSQRGGIFAESSIYTPRVQGLFNEASGLSVFSALCLIYAISNLNFLKNSKLIPMFFKENKNFNSEQNTYFSKLLIFFSLIGLFVTFSTTGFLMVLIFVFSLLIERTLLKGLRNIRLKSFIFLMIGSIAAAYLKVWELLRYTFSQGDRFKTTYEIFDNIKNYTDLNFFIGTQASTEMASWDTFTRYLQLYGIFGSIPIWFFLSYIVLSRNFFYSLFLIPMFMSNAPLSIGHSIIALGMLTFLNFSFSEENV